MKKCEGRVHSLESFGTVDGPGTRFVVFFQGCPMRCLYCHNPDTWDFSGGQSITVEEILSLYERNRSFYKNGGLTATGGEPLAQLDFLIELFKCAKEKGIHTCLDTSGVLFNREDKRYEKLIKYTDLVMLDIKTADENFHKRITGCSFDNIKNFAYFLSDNGVPTRIRHVVVPNLTYDDTLLYELGEFVGTLKSVKELEVLPYHTMGVPKYEKLGIAYRLGDTQAFDKEKLTKARQIILKGYKSTKKSQSE